MENNQCYTKFCFLILVLVIFIAVGGYYYFVPKEENVYSEEEISKNLSEKKNELEQVQKDIAEKNDKLLKINKELLNSKIEVSKTVEAKPKEEEKLSLIKEKMGDLFDDGFKLSSGELDKIKNYKFEEKSDLRDKEASKKISSYIELSEFGIKLLRNINKDPKTLPEKYESVIKDIVLRVKSFISDNYSSVVEKVTVKFKYSVTTLVSMYMLMYSKDPKNPEYHELVTKLIPVIPSLDSTEISYLMPDPNAVLDYTPILNLSTPRLLSDYINDFKAYTSDINSTGLINFDFKINSTETTLTDHIRQDSSALAVHNDRFVPYINYSFYLQDVRKKIQYPDFYAAVYSVLNVPGNYYNVVKKIISKIKHPNLNVVLHGLNNCDGKINFDFNWLDVKGELGCYLIPSIGFAVFKSEDLMFPIRISLDNAPMCVLSSCDKGYVPECNPFATSILNLRKIYFARETYNDYKTWQDVKDEPGLFLNASKTFMNYNWKNKSYSNFFEQPSSTNYIGQLKDEQVLFWKRKNRITDSHGYAYAVLEVGMFTSDGLEVLYQLSNFPAQSNTLFFTFKGKDSRVNYSVKDLMNCTEEGDKIRIPVGYGITSFKWFMLVGENPQQHNLNFYNDAQTFTYNNKDYRIENINLDSPTFTVKHNDEVILIGNNSSRLNGVIRYNDVDYYRDEGTMMYVKK